MDVKSKHDRAGARHLRGIAIAAQIVAALSLNAFLGMFIYGFMHAFSRWDYALLCMLKMNTLYNQIIDPDIWRLLLWLAEGILAISSVLIVIFRRRILLILLVEAVSVNFR